MGAVRVGWSSGRWARMSGWEKCGITVCMMMLLLDRKACGKYLSLGQQGSNGRFLAKASFMDCCRLSIYS